MMMMMICLETVDNKLRAGGDDRMGFCWALNKINLLNFSIEHRETAHKTFDKCSKRKKGGEQCILLLNLNFK